VLEGNDRRIPYDYLIIAAGARHAYFGHDEWEQVAPGLKKIEDATAIRHDLRQPSRNPASERPSP